MKNIFSSLDLLLEEEGKLSVSVRERFHSYIYLFLKPFFSSFLHERFHFVRLNNNKQQ